MCFYRLCLREGVRRGWCDLVYVDRLKMIGLTVVVFDIFLNIVVSLLMVSMVFVLWGVGLIQGNEYGI